MKTEEYDLWLNHLDRPFSFSTPFEGQEFALLLVVADPAITDDDREAICKEIIRLGCRYAVCTGDECSRWHDFIDMAYVESDPEFSPPEERFVMTTWHEDEPLEDVVEFFRVCTTSGYFMPQHYLVSLIGDETEMTEKISPSLRKWFDPSP